MWEKSRGTKNEECLQRRYAGASLGFIESCCLRRNSESGSYVDNAGPWVPTAISRGSDGKARSSGRHASSPRGDAHSSGAGLFSGVPWRVSSDFISGASSGSFRPLRRRRRERVDGFFGERRSTQRHDFLHRTQTHTLRREELLVRRPGEFTVLTNIYLHAPPVLAKVDRVRDMLLNVLAISSSPTPGQSRSDQRRCRRLDQRFSKIERL